MTGHAMRVGIFGSCVSRDLCEFADDVDVACYVARQSSIVQLAPHGGVPPEAAELDSPFQNRVFSGDQSADAADRLIRSSPDIVLVDLVDERRGVWQFPDDTFLTNSIEAYKAGIDKWAPAEGARLIEFGTDEHFDLWSAGFDQIIDLLRAAGLPAILLDVAWAELIDSEKANSPMLAGIGRIQRRAVRAGREVRRSWMRGEGLSGVITGIVDSHMPQAEEMRKRARHANRVIPRYTNFAANRADARILEHVADVRMASNHKWGLAPYHYRAEDYERILQKLRRHPVWTGASQS